MIFFSYVIIGIMTLIYFSNNLYETNIEPINYALRSLHHADITHLLFNMISLYNLSFIENIIGNQNFLFAIIFIWISSSIFLNIIHNINLSRKKYTVGFSGVIFGLIVIYYHLLNIDMNVNLIGLIISLIPQLFIPGISFEGHLCGILAGYLYTKLFLQPKIK